MRPYRRFCFCILGVLAAMVLYNAVVWHFCTRQLLSPQDGYLANDLARMGYLSNYTHPRRNIDDLPRRHVGIADYRGGHVDIVTVGDSFSQGSGNGPNRYYQDYLASRSEVEVLNVSLYPGSRNLLETVVVLLNSGFLEQARPKVLLLEIVERNCYKYALPFDPAKTDTLENLRAAYAGRAAAVAEAEEAAPNLQAPGFINTGNFKWFLYNILYRITPDAFVSKTFKVRLDQPLFSGEHGDTLLFLYKDINKVKSANPEKLRQFNDNLNQLAALLLDRGIELCFMPAPDKYSLYAPYIVDNPFPPSRFFELLRPLGKNYRFIDTEAILRAELGKGEKDLYWLDDTHWSWKASEAIFNREKFL